MALGVTAVIVVSRTAFDDRVAVTIAPSRPTPPPDIPGLTVKAEQGDAEAQYQLGAAYAQGQGITNSYAEAAKWYGRAADQGQAAAQAALGELYEAGQGVPKDMDAALRCYRAAAEHGYAGAQYTLGFLYEAGRGVRLQGAPSREGGG